MSWRHAMCGKCWNERNPTKKIDMLSAIIIDGPPESQETCCFCGKLTGDGIYVREDPALAPFCPDKGPEPAA